MSLRMDISKSIDAAFKALGDVKKKGKFISSSPNYDVSSGAVSESGPTYDIKYIQASVKVFEHKSDKTVPPDAEYKLLVKASEITEPSLIDKVVTDDHNFNVIKYTKDPTDSLFIFYVKTQA